MSDISVPGAASPEDYLPARPDAPGAVQQVAASGGTSFESLPTDVDALTAPLEDLIQALSNAGLHYEPWQVAAFVTACRTKPFVILAGISGTGKTKLPSRISKATSSRFELCPVKPDWTDSGEILGFTDLAGTFQPGRLLDVVASAAETPDQQVFFCLDEMNLARVEFYLAEVLSVLEERSRKADGSISSPALIPQAPEVAEDDTGGVTTAYGVLGLPENLTLVGTVNMDETTHGFSRKVLDRAFVLELSDVDLSVVFKGGVGLTAVDWPRSWWSVPSLSLADDPRTDEDAAKETIGRLVELNAILSRAQLQFGYRLRDEVVLFVLNAEAVATGFRTTSGTTIDPFDVAIMAKVLPRIAGGGNRIESVLSGLSSFLRLGHSSEDEAGDADTDLAHDDEAEEDGKVAFPLAYRRVRVMRQRLADDGFASYWL